MNILPHSMRFFAAILLWSACHTMQPISFSPTQYDQYPAYSGTDLGMQWSPSKTTFKLWSPAVEAVQLHLYEKGEGGSPLLTLDLLHGQQGVWGTTLQGDQSGRFYTVQVKVGGKWLSETPDPYAKAVGVNGKRGMILNLATTNPNGWANDKRPPLASPNDIILYELHVRDLSIHPNSGIQNQGKYLGLAEIGAKTPDGLSTGLDHIAALGVTHVHLLPVFDYRYTSVDETRLNEAQFNWGYDPENYNTPEGSYSTNPYDGGVRIREFKQAIQAMHSKGLRVVMDVVYNHTGSTDESVFNRVAPGYYYRHTADGKFSNASACGNETASERAMMRQYIVESVKYWANEYHIDGFRFDLMGIHDIETMNLVSAELHKIDPSIFIYGEGWTAGASPLPDDQRALKANTWKLDKVAAFSDDFRDALKGSVFEHKEKGFVSGRPGMEESIKFGIVASVQHPQVDYAKVNYSKAPWAKEPYQTITYAECHDNHALWDRLAISCPDASEEDRIKMHQLTAAMVLTSQGVPFLHAGTEMLRTKNGVENSFDSPDNINRIDWSRKTKYKAVHDYFQALIQLRKHHPAFRLTSSDLIRKHLHFLEMPGSNLVGYELTDHAGGDSWKRIIVLFNGNSETKVVPIPEGKWTVVLDGDQINEHGLRSINAKEVGIKGNSALILKAD